MTKTARPKANGPDAGFDADRVIDAAMALAAERGWERISLLDVAQRAGVPLAALHGEMPGKQAILGAFSRRVDEAVLAEHESEESAEPARDRLFDILMSRFDQLQSHREAIANILAAYQRDPALALGGLRQLHHSMRWMLEAANISTSGLRGEVRVSTLCAIYVATLRTWLHDDSPDMAKTMAALDGYLRRIERPAAVLEGIRGAGGPAGNMAGRDA